MGSVCGEQHHKFHSSHQLQLLNKKSLLREIDIPPRKLLSRRAAAACSEDVFADSPRSVEEALMQRFLPYNSGGGDSDESDSDDPYSSDHFRMYEFKVRRCTRTRSHDWTDCPFAHPGEKARRRDPRRYHYSGTVCAEFRRGGCSRGDNCEFAHGVFECWLHPSRYRTEACKDGRNCKRKVCFFAHSPRQLRLLPQQSASPPPEEKYRRNNPNHCCLYCNSPVSVSPTSTLMGTCHVSPPLSPPENHRSVSWVSPISRYGGGDRFSTVDSGYKDSVSELIYSLEGMNIGEASPHAGGNSGNLSWVDVCLTNNCEDHQQQQFVLSPNIPSPSGSGGYFSNCDSSSTKSLNFEDKRNDSGLGCPDLGWVNDLLT